MKDLKSSSISNNPENRSSIFQQKQVFVNEDVLRSRGRSIRRLENDPQKEISSQLQRQGIRCSTNVYELYLANLGFSNVHSLEAYKALHILWLNNNKIFKVDFLRFNYQITELYLQNNMIVSIAGALKHLSCLQVLLLHANQLTCSQSTINELKHMLSLRTLNLFGNPLSQEAHYRLYVIHNITSLKLLDRKSVSYTEIAAARRLFTPQCVRIEESIKFGRREFGKKSDIDIKKTSERRKYITVAQHPHSTALLPPRKRGSPMSYSLFDWETAGREFLYSKVRSPPHKITVSLE